MANKKQYSFRFKESQVKRIDKIAKKKDLTRTQFTELLYEKAILSEFGFDIDINE